MGKRYSPLGRLRWMRGAVLVAPLATLLVLAPLSMGPNTHATVISPTYRAELTPFMGPLWIVALAWLGAVRILVSAATPQGRRVNAFRVALWLALIVSWVSVVFSLAGASAVWGWAGYLFGVATILLLPISRYAHDVSDEVQPGFFS